MEPQVLEKSQYSISELASEFNITTRSIRHYEELGLISPKRKGQSRIYSPSDRTRLQLILRGRRVGFSLSEIGEIILLYKSPNGGEQKQTRFLLQKIQQRRKLLLAQKVDIDAMLSELDQLEIRLQKQHNHSTIESKI